MKRSPGHEDEHKREREQNTTSSRCSRTRLKALNEQSGLGSALIMVAVEPRKKYLSAWARRSKASVFTTIMRQMYVMKPEIRGQPDGRDMTKIAMPCPFPRNLPDKATATGPAEAQPGGRPGACHYL